MKLALLIAFCLLGAAVRGQQAVVEVVTTCSQTDSKNLNINVLKWLKLKNVTILEEPKKLADTKVCNGEFSTHGTCCDLDSVKKFIADRNRQIAGNWGKFISKLARVRGRFLAGFKKIAAKLNVQDVTAKMQVVKNNPKVVDKFKSAEKMLPSSAKDIQALKTFVDKFEDEIKAFRSQGKVCYDALRRARANLFCAACSARATSMTDQQTAVEARFRIDYNSCSALVGKCYPVWKFNFQLNTMMQYVVVNLAKTRGDAAKNSFASEKSVTPTDLGWLKDTFTNCNLSTGTTPALECGTSTITVEDYTKGLCNRLFSVNKVNSYVEGDESVDTDVTDDEVNNADAAIEPEKSEMKAEVVKKRILQALDQSNLDMGTTVATSGTYTNMNSDSTGVEPSDSVTTSSAGNASSSVAKLVTVFGVAATALLVQFF